MSLKHMGSSLVVGNLLAMLSTVELDDHFCFRAQEISNIAGDGNLPAESKSAQLFYSQTLPQMAFCVGSSIA